MIAPPLLAAFIVSSKSVELEASQATPRIDSVNVDLEQRSDLLGRHLLDVHQDKTDALLVIETIEDAFEERDRLRLYGRLVRGGPLVTYLLLDILKSSAWFSPMTVVAGNASRDGEEPARQLGARFEIGETFVYDEEDVLDRIVDRGMRNAECSKRAPDEDNMTVVDLIERCERSGHVLLARRGGHWIRHPER